MTYTFPSRTSQVPAQPRFPVTEFEPLLDSVEAAALLRIHPKTLQKMARRGQILGPTRRESLALSRLGSERLAVAPGSRYVRSFR